MILKNLAQIFSGYSFRGKVRHEVKGEVAVVQLKDIQDNYTHIGEDLVRIAVNDIKEKYYLKDGDVLFISKGVNNRAIVYNMDNLKTIASATFFILRPDKDIIVPGYLAWYLNHPSVQNILKGSLAGTYTLNLNRSAVEEIEVPLPSLAKQEIIARLNELQNREHRLMSDITEKRNLYLQTLLMNTISE